MTALPELFESLARPAVIQIQEVALRDGFQNEPSFVPTEDKIRLADQLSVTGITQLEVTSFTSPKAIPHLRDAEDVMRGITRSDDVVYTVLVPNVRGAERALTCRADEFNLVLSVSESHNLLNLRMTREQSFRQLAHVVFLARAAGVSCNISLSCAFGCPFEGDIPAASVLEWSRRFADLGVPSVTYCDTTGMAYPTQVSSLCREHLLALPGIEPVLHFHNSRGLALANVLAGVLAGVTRFDASLGGLGGCPYAPGATGNVCTEDLVHMLELVGLKTGVDLSALLKISRSLPRLLDHETPGQVAKAGKRLDLHTPPSGFSAILEEAVSRNRPNS